MAHATLGGERDERAADTGRAGEAGLPELGERDGMVGRLDDGADAVSWSQRELRRLGCRVPDLQRDCLPDPVQPEQEVGLRRGRAVLNAEEQPVAGAAQVQIRITPTTKLGPVAKGPARTYP